MCPGRDEEEEAEERECVCVECVCRGGVGGGAKYNKTLRYICFAICKFSLHHPPPPLHQPLHPPTPTLQIHGGPRLLLIGRG